MSVDVLDLVSTVDKPGETYELAPHWGDSRRVLVRQGGRTVFACVATPRTPAWWFLEECRPERDDQHTAAVLVRLCAHLRAAHGVTDVIAIHPAGWAGALVQAGAQPLRRMVPLALRLDAALLGMHQRRLPDGYWTEPLTDADPLGPLSAEASRDDDQRTWQEALTGVYGPVIPQASRLVVAETGPRAAIAVTQHRGVPFVAHLVSSQQERGNGLGRAVLVEAMLALAAAGYADCTLSVAQDNWIAHRLYRSIGFTQHGSVAAVSWLRGTDE